MDGPVDGVDTRSDVTGGDTGASTSVAEMSLGQLMEAVGQRVRQELRASHVNAPPAPTVDGGAQDGSMEEVPVAVPTDVGRTQTQSGSGEIPCTQSLHAIPACTQSCPVAVDGDECALHMFEGGGQCSGIGRVLRSHGKFRS